MKQVGGNVQAILQVKTTTQNKIGESVESYADYLFLTGWLDFVSGGTGTDNYNAIIEESTHVFVCDYVPIPLQESECRLLVNGKAYEITLIDDPMLLHQHLELYLKYTGD